MSESSTEVKMRPLHTFADIDPETLPMSTPLGFSFKYIDISAVSEGRLTIPSTSVDFAGAPSRARRVLRPGDVIMSTVRPNLKAFAYCEFDEGTLVASTGFAVLRAKENVDPYFLLCSVLSDSVTQQIGSYAVGSNYPAINSSDVRRLLIPARTHVEQKRIAAILASIDTAIEKTEALIAKHQQIKAGLMHNLFTRGVLPNGQLRPPRSEAPELYQETAIGWIPKDWQLSTLRQCLTDSPTNGIYKPAEQIGEGTLMVGQTAFTEQRSIDFTLCRRGNIEKEEAQCYGLAKDQILVTRVFATVEGVGLPTLVPQLDEPAVFESNMMRLRIDNSIVIPRLLFEWLRAPVARRHITGGANASNQCSVNQGVLNPLPVALPPLDEQARIERRIAQSDKQRETIIESLSKLKMQKLGLMQDLLTGKVAVEVDGQTSATSDQAPLEQKVLSRFGEQAQTLEVDTDAI